MDTTQKFPGKIAAVLMAVFAATVLTRCSSCKDDPCDGIICLNGGECVNGDCECPEGYEGADCGNEKVPDNIRIAKITYTEIPSEKSNGDPWDPGQSPNSNPGLTVRVLRDVDPDPNAETWSVLWDSEPDLGIYDNANPNQVQVFTPSIPVLLGSPQQKYRISLYDWDGPGDLELMGGQTFVPYTPGQGHPVQIIQANSKVRFVLDVTYDF